MKYIGNFVKKYDLSIPQNQDELQNARLNNAEIDFFETIIGMKMNQYFYLKEHSQSLSADFDKLRRKGENNQYICDLIRNDKIEEFIIYVNKNDYPINSKIKFSVYETHQLLGEKEHTLIDYAAFFGSISIFQYLYKNDVQLTPSLWLFAIHCRNQEIFDILEKNNIIPNDETYKKCLEQSIKCHHHDVTNYILMNKTKKEINEIFDIEWCFKYLNFFIIPVEIDYNILFFNACKYNYLNFATSLLKTRNIDINMQLILMHFFNGISKKKKVIFNDILIQFFIQLL